MLKSCVNLNVKLANICETPYTLVATVVVVTVGWLHKTCIEQGPPTSGGW